MSRCWRFSKYDDGITLNTCETLCDVRFHGLFNQAAMALRRHYQRTHPDEERPIFLYSRPYKNDEEKKELQKKMKKERNKRYKESQRRKDPQYLHKEARRIYELRRPTRVHCQLSFFSINEVWWAAWVISLEVRTNEMSRQPLYRCLLLTNV